MSLSKFVTSASLAFALIGGAVVFSPTEAEAAGKKKSNFISFPVLDKNKPVKGGKSKPANPPNRGCTVISKCKRR